MQPLEEITGGDWSGDGRSFVISSAIDGRQTMTIFDIESGAARTLLVAGELGSDGLPVSMPVSGVSFRPPDGAELMFVGERADGEAHGIYVIGADGSNLRPLVGPTNGLQQPHWSPDGSRVAYSQYDEATGRVFAHVVGADGSRPVVLDNPPGGSTRSRTAGGAASGRRTGSRFLSDAAIGTVRRSSRVARRRMRSGWRSSRSTGRSRTRGAESVRLQLRLRLGVVARWHEGLLLTRGRRWRTAGGRHRHRQGVDAARLVPSVVAADSEQIAWCDGVDATRAGEIRGSPVSSRRATGRSSPRRSSRACRSSRP